RSSRSRVRVSSPSVWSLSKTAGAALYRFIRMKGCNAAAPPSTPAPTPALRSPSTHPFHASMLRRREGLCGESLPTFARLGAHMFGKDARDVAAGGAPRREERIGGGPERRVAAWIGASIVIEGNLTSSEDTTIAGRVEGDVVVREHNLVVAPGGRIHGDIIARAVAVH